MIRQLQYTLTECFFRYLLQLATMGITRILRYTRKHYLGRSDGHGRRTHLLFP